ncbi:hypothetical protein ILUMI_24220 [Ignelater luminosus]|uniref:Alcohol dehydrogenase n=1 Tax=Ignelater luminosus TaxID=2038154 RepID=A0A8K0G139_IGNLU|nr:hypothetical protein ILUMI_24220 [Ignelater luminosus]
MAFKINGKVVLVTGGASGLGFAFVKEFLHNEAKGAAIVDVNSERGLVALYEIRKEFGEGRCIFLKCDVTVSNELEEAFKETVRVFKQLDIVVNNAGILNEKKLGEMRLNQFGMFINSCINGTLLAMEKYLPQYRSDKEGVVVNVSSIYGLQPFYKTPTYTATKTAVIGYSRAYGEEVHYKRTNVKIIALCPGHTQTTILDVLPEQLCEWHIELAKQEAEELNKRKLQSPEHVALNLIKIVQNGKSGSVWVVTRNEPAFEEFFPEKDYC